MNFTVKNAKRYGEYGSLIDRFKAIHNNVVLNTIALMRVRKPEEFDHGWGIDSSVYTNCYKIKEEGRVSRPGSMKRKVYVKKVISLCWVLIYRENVMKLWWKDKRIVKWAGSVWMKPTMELPKQPHLYYLQGQLSSRSRLSLRSSRLSSRSSRRSSLRSLSRLQRVQHLLMCNVDNFILFCIRCFEIMGVMLWKQY